MVDTGTVGERLVGARPHEDALERRRLRAELGTRLLGEPRRPPQIGRYVLQRPIGAGAMGVVYSALDPTLGRSVALKVLEAPTAIADAERRRLLIEAQALARLSDPNIVPVYDVGEVDGRLWIAMELVRGQTLQAWLDDRRRGWPEVTAVMLAAGRGLAAAHAAGLVHRDFKPDNVMVGDDGRVRIMDFGLALITENAAEQPTIDPPTRFARELWAIDPPTRFARELWAIDPPTRFARELWAIDPPTRFARELWAIDPPTRFARELWAIDPPTRFARELWAIDPPTRFARELWAIDPPTRFARELWAIDPPTRFARELWAIDPPTRFARELWAAAPRAQPSVPSPAVAGTPAYMAAELFDGLPASAVSDQFAYCVTFWEALSGQRPSAKAPVPPPRRPRVPDWLTVAVRRGLAADPAQRWEDMATLLAVLEGGQARARRRRWWRRASAGVGIAATLLVGQHLDRRAREQICETSGDTVEEFWNSAARDALVTGLASVDVPHAPATATSVAQMLDVRAQRWAEAHVLACMAHDVEQRWSANRLERARWCLDDRRLEFRAQVLTLAEADKTAVNRAFGVVSRLPPVDDCIDPSALDRQPAVVDDRRAAVDEVRQRLAVATARLAAGVQDEDVAVARGLVADAEAAGWVPLSAKARVLEGAYLRHAAQYDAAIESAQAAYFQAVRIPAWDVAADAASLLVAIAANRGDRDLGRTWNRHARVALEHAHDTAGIRETILLSNLGVLYAKDGEYDEARATHEQAMRLRTEVFGDDHPEVSNSLLNLSVVEYETGNYERCRELVERAVSIRQRSLGPDHLGLSIALANLATVLSATGHEDQTRELQERVVAIQEQNLGPDHPRVAMSLNNLAISYSNAGDLERARQLHERALSIRERRLGPDHPSVATTLDNLAHVHGDAGAPARAIELLERALEIRERGLGAEHPDVADSLNNLGAWLLRQGDRTRARGLIERGLSIRESTLGPDHPLVAVSLTNLAALEDDPSRVIDIDRRILSIREAALGPDHPQVARALTNLALDSGIDAEGSLQMLERAVAIFDAHPRDQPREGAARFGLARALVAHDRAPARARTLAEQALHAHRAERNADEIARVETWLDETQP